jgi:uncharacterized protein
VLQKPEDVFDRDDEWADLAEFAGSSVRGLRLAIVYGRRRQGKSYLLRRLAEANGGIYHLATEQTEAISLSRFAGSLTSWLGTPAEGFTFNDWEAALRSAVGLMIERDKVHAGPPLLVLDEFPYLVHETPALPSIVQSLYDELGPGSTTNRKPLRLVLCGSAISIMSNLLSGTKALRGRGALELRVNPFGYREAREYWEIDDVRTAFRHNALVGGTPGYRDLVPNPSVPQTPGRMGDWVARNILRPNVPLFDEADRVIHEDPRLRDTAVYGSLMAVIAAGETSPSKIGGLLGRQSSSLTYQLRMLESAGFVDRHQDLLTQKRPAITVADPIVRFHHLVIEPFLGDLEAGRAREVWDEVQPTLSTRVFGPHLETLARTWVSRYGRDEADLEVGTVGHATVPCRDHRTSHEIDILGLARGSRGGTKGTRVAFLGEAKAGAGDGQPGVAVLERLDHIRGLLTATGSPAEDAVLGIFSASGFSDDLRSEARRRRGGVLLADLDRLYGS